MIDPRFVLLGAALSLVGSIRYAWQTIHGRTRPNRVTWTLWATAPIIGFVAQLDDGVGLPAVMTLSIGVGPALILAASFVNRDAYWQLTRFDLACGAVSVGALAVWLSLDDPAVAVVFALLADLMGGIPTVVKSWRAPETEDPSVFALSGANGVVTLLTLRRWDVSTWAFPVYIAAIGTLLTLIVLLRPRQQPVPA